MRKFEYVFLFLILLSVNGFADSYGLLDSANRAYQEARYDEAIQKYDSILGLGLESSEIYYNLGNAWFKKNNIGNSILFWERAARLSPSDDDIQYNLGLARSMLVDKSEQIPPFFFSALMDKMAGWKTSNAWALLSCSFFILLLLGALLFLFSSVSVVRKISFSVSCFFLILFMVFLSFSVHQKKVAESSDVAIIMTQVVTAKSSPDDAGSDLFVIHEGTKVNIEDRLGEWCEIKIGNGDKGWILENNLEII